MRTVWRDSVNSRWLRGLLVVLSLSGCGTTYHFRYHYALVSPPDATEGVEDDQIRIHLRPEPESGVMQLSIANKSVQTLTIVWDQTHFIDPLGRRRPATETGLGWFFRPREWFADDTHIAPGEERRTRVQPGERQAYNPLIVSRTAGGEVTLSTTPSALFPTTSNTAALGRSYQGREFRFVLALRRGTDVTHYPFTFRITDVDVQ